MKLANVIAIASLVQFSLASQASLAQEFPLRPCCLVSKKQRSISAAFTFEVAAPELLASEWIIYVPSPPDLPGKQRLTGSEYFVNTQPSKLEKIKEESPSGRNLFLSRIAVNQNQTRSQLHTRTHYFLDLYSSTLSRTNSPGTPVNNIIGNERELYLIDTKTLDFNSDYFRSWLKNEHLERKNGEGDLDFAWRSFLQLRRSYKYHYDINQDRCASQIARSDSSDCGGLSFLYTSILRANKIPARALVGRWLKDNPSPDEPENGFGQVHVKSEFFADKIGWIPVDLSLAIREKDKDALDFFGKIDGNFVTFHTDPDLVLNSYWFGIQNIAYLQSPVFWVTGTGNLNKMSVKKIWQTRE